MERYDEDISENPFYKGLLKECANLAHDAAANNWIVCVPRRASIANFVCTSEDYENHILISSDEESSTFKTLNGKELTIHGNVITTGNDFSELQTIHILFEETFYTKDAEGFQLLCLENLLEGSSGDVTDSGTNVSKPLSMRECTEFLWRHIGDQRVFQRVDELISSWNETHQNLEFETVPTMRDLTSELYTKALQLVLKDPLLKKTVWGDKYLMEALKLAVETYTIHGAYQRLMKGVTACLSREDSLINKTIRNLSDLQLRDLNIKSNYIMIVPHARQELSHLEWYCTPLDKLGCIRKTVEVISRASKQTDSAMSTDDLLPVLVFLVLKTGLANWLAHLVFIKNFRLSRCLGDAEKDENGFYLSSLEAAIEHIRSGVLLGSSEPECQLDEEISPEGDSSIFSKMDRSKDNDSSPSIKAYFELVKKGETEKVRELLEEMAPLTQAISAPSQLCHPLCSCDRCEQLQQKKNTHDSVPTVASRDDRGFTALHIAALYGQDLVLDALINHAADPNATDYRGCTPLHLACQRGHQNATLLLLHHGAIINVVDNDGNTPIHLCALNGHEDCVKALVYYDEHVNGCSIQVNATNDNGDTPLHHASRWGYDSIVELLLEFGACVEAKNKRLQTPLDCAHNANVLRFLQRAAEDAQARQNSGFIRLELPSQSPPSIATVTAARQAMSRSKLAGPQPARARDFRRVDKLMKAVSLGDVKLACFYLGIENDFDAGPGEEMENLESRVLCHPLCQCHKCRPLQKNSAFVPVPGSEGLWVNSTDADGNCPLHVACVNGQVAMSKFLLDHGSSPDVRDSERERTPLHIACQHNKPELVELLLKRDALVNVSDSAGNTPLHYCCQGARTLLARRLIQAGAVVNQVNNDGNSAMHEAVRRNGHLLAEILLQYGADPLLLNKKRLTPRDFAQDAEMLRLIGRGCEPASARNTS